MIVQPKTCSGYNLFHEGFQALADVESQGIRVDVDYFQKELERLKESLQQLAKEVRSSKLGELWRKRSGGEFNMDNNSRLGEVLYKDLGMEPPNFTDKGEGATDEDALTRLQNKNPDLAKVLLWRKRKNTTDYLEQILQEQVDGYMYPFFHLHIPRTFRGSCSGPNLQQASKRNKEQMNSVRHGVIPRDGNFLAEFDFKSLEVNVGCCNHMDDTMVEYLVKGGDMHYDIISRVCMLPKGVRFKDDRYCGKNGFVFPEFYGRKWMKIAPVMWEMLQDKKMEDGTPILKYLESQGVRGLGRAVNNRGRWKVTPGSFYEHIKKVEEWLWNEQFPGYASWREKTWESYQKNGYIDLLSGFRCKGLMSWTQVINYPIQGPAFHVLLRTLILLNNELRKRGFLSRIIGQIHDSILMDVYPPEWRELTQLVKYLATEKVPDEWRWIQVPLHIDAERGSIGKGWNRLREVSLN